MYEACARETFKEAFKKSQLILEHNNQLLLQITPWKKMSILKRSSVTPLTFESYIGKNFI
jgi:hypothetical protein